MSHADVLEDSYPHGTPEGYDGFGEGGCRGGSCPAGIEHGLSCKIAKQKSRGDYQYQKLAKTGASPAEIAAALGFVGELPTGTPKPKSKPAPKARPAPAPIPAPTPEPAVDMPQLATGGVTEGPVLVIIGDNSDGPETVQPLSSFSNQEADEPAAEPATGSAEAAVTAEPTTREIREWARGRGYEIGAKGAIPKHIRAHYDEAHNIAPIADLDTPPAEPDTDTPEPDTTPADPITQGDDSLTPTGISLAGVSPNLTTAEITPSEPTRPEWGYVALQEDLRKAMAASATMLEQRDAARDLAAHLAAELHRMEATLTEHRERASNALADYLRDLGKLERDRDAATAALATTTHALRSTENALELVVQKWGELKADQAPRLLLTTVQPNQHTEVQG